MDNKIFDSKRIALGYTKRPWLHKNVMEQIKKDCCLRENFKNGLDVGCGAGLSTKALKLICDKVTGTDISPEMISVCNELYKKEEYEFYVAKAEETIIPRDKYDIVTAAGVINWVNKERFLENMNQVTALNGQIVIYDFWITDKMADGDTAYTTWYNDKYLQRFPKPPRQETIWQQSDLPENFTMENQVFYNMTYDFSVKDFVDFMMIQSNVNAQIEIGQKTVEEVKNWMYETLSPIFNEEGKTLIFSGYNWYIKKTT